MRSRRPFDHLGANRDIAAPLITPLDEGDVLVVTRLDRLARWTQGKVVPERGCGRSATKRVVVSVSPPRDPAEGFLLARS